MKCLLCKKSCHGLNPLTDGTPSGIVFMHFSCFRRGLQGKTSRRREAYLGWWLTAGGWSGRDRAVTTGEALHLVERRGTEALVDYLSREWVKRRILIQCPEL